MSAPRGPLLSHRSAFVVAMAATIGLMAGMLSFFADANLPSAVLVGGASIGACIALLQSIVGE